MPSCSFEKCTNHSRRQNKSTGITFHAFPKDELLRHKWLRIVQKQRREPDWAATNNSRVCSCHFKSDDMYMTNKGLRKIKKGALPFVQITTKPHVPESKFNSPTSLDNVNISDEDSIFETPRKAYLKRRIEKIYMAKKKLLKENKNLKGQNKRLKQKCFTLKQTVQNLKKKVNLPEDQFRELSLRAEAADLYQRMTQNIICNKNSRKKITPSLRKFALTLNFYSPAGYKYVRKVFKDSLPHPRTIGKWYENTDALPGFTSQSFDLLKKKHDIYGKRITCTLIIDEMAIRQQTIWNGKKTLGLVDHGIGSLDTDQIASQVLVMMLVCVNQNWKLPVGYFFVNGIAAESRANLIRICFLIRICLSKCWDVGVDVVALTFDGCPSNINAANVLGCQLSDINNLKTIFRHPSCDMDVAVFLDPCHMLKLVRNTFESKKIFYDDQGRQVKWQLLVNLLKLQESETLNFANKLTPRHIDFRNQIMKVKLATQLLSLSVANALKLCEELLLSSNFVNTEATVAFIEKFNHLFDITNSRKRNHFGYKKPIWAENKTTIFNFMNDMKEYICSLSIYTTYRRTQRGKVTVKIVKQKLVQAACKTGFVGFIICIESLKHLYATLIETNVLEYISTYRISQDHLELFFGIIRRQGGYNNNPNTRQFQGIYRKVLGHLELRSSFSGNCIPLDNFPILNCTSAVETINRTLDIDNIDNDEGDNLYAEKSFSKYKNTQFGAYKRVREIKNKISVVQASDMTAESNVDILSDVLDTCGNLSISAEQIVGYIAGWVARTLIKTIKCETCVTALVTNQKLHFHKLIVVKDMGGLCYASYDLYKICQKSENSLKLFIKENKSQHFLSEKQMMRLKLNIITSFIQSDIFSNLNEHSQDQPATFNHRTHLLKAIIDKYCDVRLHYLHKTDSAISSTTKRQKRNKLSLFEGK